MNAKLHVISTFKNETTDCWQLLGMDLFGPWPVTEQRNQYVCVLTDLFSKFVVAPAIPNKEAASVDKVVVSLCTTYGAPQRILTDQDREFNNKVRKYYTLSENGLTGQVGLGVGSWPSNRATEGSNPKGTRLYFVILLKNEKKIFDWH